MARGGGGGGGHGRGGYGGGGRGSFDSNDNHYYYDKRFGGREEYAGDGYWSPTPEWEDDGAGSTAVTRRYVCN